MRARKTVCLVCTSCALLAASAAGEVITFTGDVDSDFAVPGAVCFADTSGTGDVGWSPDDPCGTEGRFDLEGVAVAYDTASDTLFVGVDTVGNTGSLDSQTDGAILFCIDLDGPAAPPQSVRFEVGAGITLQMLRSDEGQTGIGVFDPPRSYVGLLREGLDPNTAQPAGIGTALVGDDYEFSIVNFSSLIDASPGDPFRIGFNAFTEAAGPTGGDVLGVVQSSGARRQREVY